MSFVDTSAIVAILLGEPEADLFADFLANDPVRITAPHVRLESAMILARNLGLEVQVAEQLFDDFLTEAKVQIIPITDSIGREAVRAYSIFGKGRGHPAQLNFGDCLSYACAAVHKLPILFKGGDFLHTDLSAAV